MARVFVCRLSPKRLALLRDAPQLLRELRASIRGGAVPGAIDLGRFDPKRRARLATRLGPAAWAEASRIIDGDAGEVLRRDARVLARDDVAHVVASLAPEAEPGRAGSVEAVADALRGLLRDAHAAGEHVLVLSATAADRRAARTRLAARETHRGEIVEVARQHRRARLRMSELDELVLRVGLRTPRAGLRHVEAAERRGTFHDLRDRLFEPETHRLRQLVVDAIGPLVILWASSGAHPDSRHLAALLLGEIGEGVGRGGPYAEDVRAALRMQLGGLEDHLDEIVAETDTHARAALARALAAAAPISP